MSEIPKVIDARPGPDLNQKRTRGIENWHRFLEIWENEDTHAQLSGMLHQGFTVDLERKTSKEPTYTEADRFSFYLAVARGWKEKTLEAPGDHYLAYNCGKDERNENIRRKEGDFRVLLARKAFEMLVAKLVGRKDEYGGISLNWTEDIVPLLPQLEAFFHVEHPAFNVGNLEVHSGHTALDDQALRFLIALARFMWRWKEPDYTRHDEDFRAEWDPYHQELRRRIDAAKPWMIRVLNAAGKLNVIRGEILTLDEECLRILREIAMETRIVDPVSDEYRHVQNLDEAFLKDCRAARFLVEYGTKKQVADRHAKLRETEEGIKKLTETREQLTQGSAT